MKTMLFNPYSGLPRHPSDIASDPEGILMPDPDEPVRSYVAELEAQRQAGQCEWMKAVLASATDACLDASEKEDPRSLLARLIEHHVALALDPRISSRAQRKTGQEPASDTEVGNAIHDAHLPDTKASRKLMGCVLHNFLGLRKINQPAAPKPTVQLAPDAEIAALRQIISGYYLALDRREHGAVAASNALNRIEQALGMQWVQAAAATLNSGKTLP